MTDPHRLPDSFLSQFKAAAADFTENIIRIKYEQTDVFLFFLLVRPSRLSGSSAEFKTTKALNVCRDTP